jgi:8-oxo-dGTP pyrophosphatase MutT (NUDIX family)
MTAYTTSPLKIWTPRRNAQKPTYGGMLDNTVAGGIPSGMGVMDTLVKESEEEASLPAELVRGSAKAVGVISYFYQRSPKAGGESGLLQPEVQYCYDLEVGEDVVPKPCDDEVQDFHLLTVDEVGRQLCRRKQRVNVDQVKEELANGSFKSNCSLGIWSIPVLAQAY